MSVNVFSSILTDGTLTPAAYALLLAAALVSGMVISLTFSCRAAHSKGFNVMLALLPAVVATIVVMVSGSLGASVAVAGTFSLVRFRSAPGTALEIGALLTATAAGLACGMGWPLLAMLFTAALCLAALALIHTPFGEKKGEDLKKSLQITLPEDLEYAGVFDDIFTQYTTEARMIRVKTTNLGSLNRLSYDLVLRPDADVKAFIDALRCRNGNLEISLGARAEERDRL